MAPMPPPAALGWRRSALALALLAALLAGACRDSVGPSGPSGPPQPQAGPAVRIEIAPSAVLLTAAGTTRQLVAVGYDADGNETEVDVTWSTSDASVAAIAADGTLTAANDAGSAQVVARAGTLASPPALVVVAQPVAGAVLVEDEQLVSGPVAVSPDDEYGVGWRYSVRLRGMGAPAPGTVLLAAGGAPIAGRVVDVAPAGSDIDVTLELMPLPELFERLVIDETIPLDADDAQLEASLVRDYSLARGLAGEIVLAPRTAGNWSTSAAAVTAAAGEFQLGPFTCETDGSAPEIDLPKPEIKLEQSLNVQIGYNDGLERLAVVGDIDASFGYRPVLKVALEGEVDCTATPLRIPIPITGFASWAFAAMVPIGVGLKLEAALTLAEVGFDVSAKAGASATLGVECPGGGACGPLTSFEKKPLEHAFELIAPDEIGDQEHLELGVTGYALAKLAFGSPLLASAQLELLEGQAGIKQAVDLKWPHAQVEDEEYASSFELTSEITLEPGEDLQKGFDALGELLGVEIDATLELADDLDPLAESPKGTLTIEPAAVTAGDTTDVATFTVELDPVTYVGLESVDSVQIFWKKEDDAGGFTLEPGLPECNVLPADAGQKTFECETSFLEEHIGKQTFAAFVYAKLFDVPIPIPLEIAMDTVDVQPNVECGMPDEWSIPGITDESEVEGGRGSGSLTGPTIDYLSVSGAVTVTADTFAWSPEGWLDATAIDYVRVIPLVPGPFNGGLYAHTYGTGFAHAVVTEAGCCGRTGDADAEIALGSSWGPGVDAAAGASYSNTLDEEDYQEVAGADSVWFGWGDDADWQQMETRMYGRVRHRGTDRSSTVSGSLSVTVLDIRDGDGNSIPAVVCSAAGYNYGTFVGESGPVVASRPVRQVPAGMR